MEYGVRPLDFLKSRSGMHVRHRSVVCRLVASSISRNGFRDISLKFSTYPPLENGDSRFLSGTGEVIRRRYEYSIWDVLQHESANKMSHVVN
jgi:hypothetical protein